MLTYVSFRKLSVFLTSFLLVGWLSSASFASPPASSTRLENARVQKGAQATESLVPASSKKMPSVAKGKVRKPRNVKASKAPDISWWNNMYLVDWGVSAALAGGGLGLMFVPPSVRPFQADDPSLGLEHREDTIHEGLAFGLSAGIPLLTFGLAQIWLKSGHDFHHATLGLTEAMSFTFFATNLLKVTVGRLRPDFLSRCQPNGDGQCTGEDSKVRRGRRSFPSGHTSIAFAGGVYLSLYLWGRLHNVKTAGGFWKVPIILAPIVGSTLMGVSRILDNRHHWEDVLVGGLLGAGFAILAYHINFPAPWSKDAGKPYKRHRLSILPIIDGEKTGLAVSGTF